MIVDIYEIVHRATFLGRPLLNVYHVERDNTAENAATISDAFQNSILPTLRAFQLTDVVNIDTLVFNLGTSTDFGTFTLAAATGNRALVASPRFVGPGIRFPSTDRAIRSGFKRFGGGSEIDYTDGVLTAAALSLMDDTGTVLVADWLATSDSHVVCNYVIIGRVCKTLDPVTGKCLQYRLPETDAELKFYTPQTSVTQTDVTSQTSRK